MYVLRTGEGREGPPIAGVQPAGETSGHVFLKTTPNNRKEVRGLPRGSGISAGVREPVGVSQPT